MLKSLISGGPFRKGIRCRKHAILYEKAQKKNIYSFTDRICNLYFHTDLM